MAKGLYVYLLTVFLQFFYISADTNINDAVALTALMNLWQNTPPDWKGSDPCGQQWEGIGCTNNRLTSIQLSGIGLNGSLTGDIQSFTELSVLVLSYNKGLTGPLPASIGSLTKLTNLTLLGCSFSGQIPGQIGSITELVFLSLNKNRFSGIIPPEIGNLAKLLVLDLADNLLTGPIPVSSGSKPGLDNLTNTRHFHLGNNQLSGTIPAQLFSPNMQLIHLLLENNKLTGEIPGTLGHMPKLEVVRLDRNSLSGPVPSNLNNLTTVNVLHVSNNKFTGPLPNLTGLSFLKYVDLSSNSFDATDVPPWFSTLQSLTTLLAKNANIRGQLPPTVFSIPQLQTLDLRDNHINGSLEIADNYSTQLQKIDLQNNKISKFVAGVEYNNELILVGNPVCKDSSLNGKYCTLQNQLQPPSSTSTQNCMAITCASGQTPSPKCMCSCPYVATLFLRSPSFSSLANATFFKLLEEALMKFFISKKLPVDNITLSNPALDATDYLKMNLEICPAQKDRFSLNDMSQIGCVLSHETLSLSQIFGPYFFIGEEFSGSAEKSKKVSVAVVAGVAAGGSVLLLALISLVVYAYLQRRKAKTVVEQNKPFGPQLKGARWFSFDELKKCTNNFSEANDIGSGGYGRVYRGVLPTGLLVAIKRAQQASMQGGLEFRTEIELLSRVHHKNVVSLVGFCSEQGEQILVYEYLPNGSLKESLLGKSGVRLDWKRRLDVALGTARGLSYLHELVNPPIIHRDIKSNNILLDDNLNAKVADFGLSKLMGESGKGHVTTQVKGTVGYLDPEYYMTQQLTEKSDVYSFGVVMLELITAKNPIERGRYIVREVKKTMYKKKDLYGLHELLDPAIGLAASLVGFEKFVDLAMRCLEESGADRPAMSEAAKEIESIMHLAGMNPNAGSPSTSESYEGIGRGNPQNPYGKEALFDQWCHSAVFND